jgi:hypothetical protein
VKDNCPGEKLANEKRALWSQAAKLTILNVIA